MQRDRNIEIKKAGERERVGDNKMCDRKRVMYGGLKHVTPHSSCSGKLNTSGFNPRPPPFVDCCQTETNMQT